MASPANAAANIPFAALAEAIPTRHDALTARPRTRNRPSPAASPMTNAPDDRAANDGFRYFHRYRLAEGDATKPV